MTRHDFFFLLRQKAHQISFKDVGDIKRNTGCDKNTSHIDYVEMIDWIESDGMIEVCGKLNKSNTQLQFRFAQSVGAVEYTDCTSTEG